MTLAAETPAPPAVTDDAPELDAHIANLMAARLLGKGHTSEMVREYAGTRSEFGYMWRSIADAMDTLTAAVPAQRTAPAREAAPA
jgi:hypothetical protein